jgi:hypothetical protein
MRLIENKKHKVKSSALKRVKLDVINIYHSNGDIWEKQDIETHNLITSSWTLYILNNDINR